MTLPVDYNEPYTSGIIGSDIVVVSETRRTIRFVFGGGRRFTSNGKSLGLERGD
jgi:hypothetical protein